ncbi:MAG: hypothetical protein GWO22_19015, partial [Actinobacteria bacterium]|nr:hypothetical protein [Actinomycetota bacterium]
MTSTLERYGLGSLAGWLSQRLIENASQDELLLELYDRPEFKAAYPEIEARRQLAEQRGMTMVPISPDDVLDYRSAAGALMRSYGLPS